MPQYRLSTFVTLAMPTVLTVAAPLSAQISGGTRNAPPTGDLSQRIAIANAEFASLLAKALSPENVQAVMRLIKEEPAGTTSVTNFDDASAPCDFVDTPPLRGREQFAGFLAPKPDGGAILNGCSGFGIDPLSEPNFLAFDNESFYSGGGVPPLSVSGGSNPGFPIAVVAFGEFQLGAAHDRWHEDRRHPSGRQSAMAGGRQY
jgi:hypothetical protein